MRRRLGLLPLIMILFFTISGGAFGLENVIQEAGPGMGLLLIALVPFFWSLPAALMVMELSSAIPEEGGYYIWVRRALGEFWGFQEGWWSWINSFVDMAVYPVLFAENLSSLLSQQLGCHLLETSPMAHWGATLVVIWFFAFLNIRGVKPVGDSSGLFFIFILLPFVTLIGIGLFRFFQHPVPVWQPFVPPDMSHSNAFGAGLYVVMWNYMGWDCISTISGEIEKPERNLPKALTFALPLIIASYFLPVFAGLVVAPDWHAWTTGYFPTVAHLAGGRVLGIWLGIGALVSSAGLFSALLLAYSRLPFVIARDGWLPPIFTRMHPKYGTPVPAILLCATIYSIFTLSTFSKLIIIDVTMYTVALLLEFVALIVLRIREPELPRPFRVPGGLLGAILLPAAPVLILGLAIHSRIEKEGLLAIGLAAAALATGPIIYLVVNRFGHRDRWHALHSNPDEI